MASWREKPENLQGNKPVRDDKILDYMVSRYVWTYILNKSYIRYIIGLRDLSLRHTSLPALDHIHMGFDDYTKSIFFIEATDMAGTYKRGSIFISFILMLTLTLCVIHA